MVFFMTVEILKPSSDFFIREQSAKITQNERDIAISRLEVYREWFSKEVMQAGTCNTIVIIPIENISPRYRDDATSVTVLCKLRKCRLINDRCRFWPIGVPMLFLSPISGGPELTIPSKSNPGFNSCPQAYVFSRTGALPLESDQQA